MVLRVVETGAVAHHHPTAHHTQQMPSRADTKKAAIKIIAHLGEKEADKCDAEIDILRRFLCL